MNRFFDSLCGDRTHDSCIRGKRLSARPQGPHGRERTTPRQILKYVEIIFPQWHRNYQFFSILTNTKLKRFDMHWLIESIPDGFWSLFPMPDGFWRVAGAIVEK